MIRYFQVFAIVAVTHLCYSTVALAESWRPVTPQDLAQTAPLVDKNADAEALLFEAWVTDKAENNMYPHSYRKHYVRLKIFTDRGKDRYGTVELAYVGKINIFEVAGRTIKRDGTIVELRKDAIFDKSVIRTNGLRVRAKSFALPGVEPGAIIEYQWSEDRSDQLANYQRLPLQFEFPVQEVLYHIKPLSSQWVPYHMRLLPFNCGQPDFHPEAQGYYALAVRNVPALSRESQMPPDDQVAQWVLVFYEPDYHLTPEKYWNELGRKMYQQAKSEITVNGEVKRIAESAVEGAQTADKKLEKLVRYCRSNLKDIAGQEISREERADAKRNKTTLDTLRQGAGTRYQINLAFASLAIAEGFDARVVRLPDRGDRFFDKNLTTPYFLRSYGIAVDVDGKWRFYDVANHNLPVGMLRWQEEGVMALISDPKESTFVQTPITPADKSRVSRIANFNLDAEGTLDGDVRIIMSGHEAVDWRTRFGAETPAEREQVIRRGVRARFADAQVTSISVTLPDDVSNGAGFTYHVKVPGYAQRTGKRLFITPAFFEIGSPARFTESQRQYPIYFHYPWSAFDSIRIKLPEGYDLDHPDAPASLRFMPTGEYLVKISVSNDKILSYERQFAMGANGNVLFDPQNYDALKHVFDQVRERDGHIITLKVKEPATSSTSN